MKIGRDPSISSRAGKALWTVSSKMPTGSSHRSPSGTRRSWTSISIPSARSKREWNASWPISTNQPRRPVTSCRATTPSPRTSRWKPARSCTISWFLRWSRARRESPPCSSMGSGQVFSFDGDVLKAGYHAPLPPRQRSRDDRGPRLYRAGSRSLFCQLSETAFGEKGSLREDPAR